MARLAEDVLRQNVVTITERRAGCQFRPSRVVAISVGI